MSAISVKQQNSQADILNPFYSGQRALIWKKKGFFRMIKLVPFLHQRIYQGLNDNRKYYDILCKEKSFLFYQ